MFEGIFSTTKEKPKTIMFAGIFGKKEEMVAPTALAKRQSLDLGLPQIGGIKSSTPTTVSPETKDTAQIVANLAREALGIKSAARLTAKITGQEKFVPETKLEKLVLGEEPIEVPKGKISTGLEALGVIPVSTIGKIKPVAKAAGKVAEVIEKAIPEISKISKGFKWTERGFIKSVKEELPQLKVAGQYVSRSTDRLAIKARNLIKTDLATAEKIATTRTDDDAIAIGSELLKHYTDEAEKVTSEAVKDALYTRAGDLANDMARTLTEQGRSIQAASILGRLTPEGQLKFAAREIQKYNQGLEGALGRTRGILGLQKKIE